MTRTPRSLTAIALFVLLAPFASAPATAGESDPLTLRVNDAVAAPGGTAAVVIRTYSSRPVGQGQLDFIPTARQSVATVLQVIAKGPQGADVRRSIAPTGGQGTAGPLAPHLIGHVVFSANGDVQSVVRVPRNTPDTLMLQFASPTASVNALDGPLAALFFRLPPNVAPGTVIDLDIGLSETLLLDGDGNPVPFEVEPGFLLVRAPDDPRLLLADGDRVAPGETAELEVTTLEQFAIGSGHLVLHYDPLIASGPPVVRFDSRYGRASFTADLSTPGTIVLDFESPETSLNRIPGSFIQLYLPTRPSTPVGTVSPFEIDREESWLRAPGAAGVMAVEMVDATIEFE